MASRCGTVLLFVLWRILGVYCDQTPSDASFYGTSYILYPLEDSSSDTDVRIQFKTHRPDGLILLALGRTDYCIIELKGGRVRARLQLGTGEAVIVSPAGVAFNDLQIHNIHLSRKNNAITLTIDGDHNTKVHSPGRFFELNIHNGIYIGGVSDDFRNQQIGPVVNFRGCLRYASFNTLNLFTVADGSSRASIEGVTWDCNPEFESGPDIPISFIESKSFACFPRSHTSEKFNISFDLRTRSSSGFLVHSLSEHSSVAVEIQSGVLQLKVADREDEALLKSYDRIDDGQWHHVGVTIVSNEMQLNVDGRPRDHRLVDRSDRYFGDYLYLGGSLEQRDSRLTRSSLHGCMKNIEANRRRLGLREAVTTRDVRPYCLWMYPCISNPCIEGARCVEIGLDDYNCLCNGNGLRCLCNGNDCYRRYGDLSWEQIVHIAPIYPPEGGKSIITERNINFNDEQASRFEKRIMFDILRPPEFGQIHIDGFGRRDGRFSFTDLAADRIVYVHDGSETTRDSIEFKVLLNGSSDDSRGNSAHRFILPIGIIPRNDRPVLKLSTEIMLVVTKSSITITSEMIQCLDDDNTPQELSFSVDYISGPNYGFFEQVSTPGVPITYFTQYQINNLEIEYNHRGSVDNTVELEVSDGVATSESQRITFKPVAVELRVRLNTGLSHSPNVDGIIGPQNLTTVTNLPGYNLMIRYVITDPPQNGLIQVSDGSGWQPTSSFSQAEVNEYRLRYIRNPGTGAADDRFRFVVYCMQSKTTEQTFRIKYEDPKLSVIVRPLFVRDGRSAFLSSGNLLTSTLPATPPRFIVYKITVEPNFGDIHIKGLLPTNDDPVLHRNSVFSQEQVNKQEIYYKPRRKSETVDHLLLDVFAPNGVSQSVSMAVKPEGMNRQLVNNPLSVIEGQRGIISRSHLSMPGYPQYEVVIPPKHGILQSYDQITMKLLDPQIHSFTDTDIENGHIRYQHDDSETKRDSCTLRATSELGQVTEVKFHFLINLRNDNPPERVVEKVFHVVLNSGRVLTSRDLFYRDLDESDKDSDLVYTWPGIDNADLVMSRDHTQAVTRFTGQDLQDGTLYIKHHGEPYARTIITVTDSQFEVEGLFEIRGSAPFIKVADIIELSVAKGGTAPLLVGKLVLETNQNTSYGDIICTMTGRPSHGKVIVGGEDRDVFRFTEIQSKSVVYHHNGDDELSDTFRMKIRAASAVTQASVTVTIVQNGYTDAPMHLTRSLSLSPGESVKLKRQLLDLSDREFPDMDLLYTVKNLTLGSRLKLQTDGSEVELMSGSSFSKYDVKSEHLYYERSSSSTEEQRILFDIRSNQIQLGTLELVVSSMPSTMDISVRNITVSEGDKSTLNIDLIDVPPSSIQEDMVFTLIKKPSYGKIATRSGSVHRFSIMDLREGNIMYVHDHSESTTDRFTFVAFSRTTLKQSYPMTVYVRITPVNDETPTLRTNKVLHVWTGSATVIDNGTLMAFDLDSEAGDVIYAVTRCVNGRVALVESPEEKIMNFTQTLIDEGQVVFVHEGTGNRAAVNFFLTDGLNAGTRQRLMIRAKRLEINIVRNIPLDVFPSTTQRIRTQNLLSRTNDRQVNRTILYTIKQKPKYGTIVDLRKQRRRTVNEFYQSEVDANVIAYYQRRRSGFLARILDSFIFDISSEYADSVDQLEFTVHITSETIKADNVEQYIQITGASVTEGHEVFLTESNINITDFLFLLQEKGYSNPHVSYQLTGPPLHGEMLFDGQIVTQGTIFQQQDIRQRRIKYVHDGGETASDRFLFLIFIGRSDQVVDDKGHNHDFNEFKFSIIPVNDRPMDVRVNNPVIEVLQGSSVILTDAQINVTDLDTGPEYLRYDIVDPLTNGHLANVRAPNSPIFTFTQKDVIDKVIIYKHTNSLVAGSVTFRISEDRRNDVIETLEVQVIPVYIRVTPDTIRLKQTQTTKLLTPELIKIFTNGNLTKTTFNTTVHPTAGKLIVNGRPSIAFSYNDLSSGNVIYQQLDLSADADSMQLLVDYNQMTSERLMIPVLVQALLTRRALNITSHDVFPFTTVHLNATELSVETGSDPKYDITEQPKYGQIVVIQQGSSRRKRSVSVSSFTHNDVVEQKIGFLPAKRAELTGPVVDGFSFILSADGVPPAASRLEIKVDPLSFTPIPEVVMATATAPAPVSATMEYPLSVLVGMTTGSGIDSSNRSKPVKSGLLSRDYLMMIFLVVGLVILALIILAVMKCIHRPNVDKDAVAPPKPSHTFEGVHGFSQPRTATILRPTMQTPENSRYQMSTLTRPPDRRPSYDTPTMTSRRSFHGIESMPSLVHNTIDRHDRSSTNVSDETEVKLPAPRRRSQYSTTMDTSFQELTNTNPVLKDSKYWV